MPAVTESAPLDITIREAHASDISEILRQRCRMYEDMSYRDKAALAAMASVSSAYLQKAPWPTARFAPGLHAIKGASLLVVQSS